MVVVVVVVVVGGGGVGVDLMPMISFKVWFPVN